MELAYLAEKIERKNVLILRREGGRRVLTFLRQLKRSISYLPKTVEAFYLVVRKVVGEVVEVGMQEQVRTGRAPCRIDVHTPLNDLFNNIMHVII